MNATISHITEGSPAEQAGLHKGDVLLSINGHPVRDVIDYMYHCRESALILKVQRGSRSHTLKIDNKDENASPGFELKSFRIRSCRNKCMFCFVSQLPKGMRKPLYVKDDDYRMSFLFGNYITLTNLTPQDKQRVFSQRLSPLYISVHTTNNALRRKMLGNPKAPDILQEIQEFTSNKIRLHTQIVLCPGLNDGEELSSTIKDLQKFYPHVASIAVVPVGLTRFGKTPVKPVKKDNAAAIIETVINFRKRFKKRHGDPLVYIADELYLKAEMPFPALKEYGDLPQIENGVGMVPVFMHSAKKIKLPKKIAPVRAATFTGASFMPHLEEFSMKLKTIEGLDLDIFKVENSFFGPTVTVAGLLTGKDILKTIVGKTKADCLLVPDVTLKSESDVFLDNVTIRELEESLGMRVRVIESTPEGLLKGIMDESKR